MKSGQNSCRPVFHGGKSSFEKWSVIAGARFLATSSRQLVAHLAKSRPNLSTRSENGSGSGSVNARGFCGSLKVAVTNDVMRRMLARTRIILSWVAQTGGCRWKAVAAPWNVNACHLISCVGAFFLLSGGSPRGATSFPDRGSYEYDQIRVSLCLLCLVV